MDIRSQERVTSGLACAAVRNLRLHDKSRRGSEARARYDGIVIGIRMSLFAMLQVEHPDWSADHTWSIIDRLMDKTSEAT